MDQATSDVIVIADPAPMNDFAQQTESMGLGMARTVLSGFPPDVVPVYTTLAMGALSVSFLPSSGDFRSDIAGPVIKPLLKFLFEIGSYYFVDAYPYFAWSSNPSKLRSQHSSPSSAPTPSPYRDPDPDRERSTSKLPEAAMAAAVDMGAATFSHPPPHPPPFVGFTHSSLRIHDASSSGLIFVDRSKEIASLANPAGNFRNLVVGSTSSTSYWVIFDLVPIAGVEHDERTLCAPLQDQDLIDAGTAGGLDEDA